MYEDQWRISDDSRLGCLMRQIDNLTCVRSERLFFSPFLLSVYIKSVKLLMMLFWSNSVKITVNDIKKNPKRNKIKKIQHPHLTMKKKQTSECKKHGCAHKNVRIRTAPNIHSSKLVNDSFK